jgi:hypothetical protein
MTGGAARGELILYRTEDGRAAIRLRVVDGTVWLTQAEIADLFDTTPQNVTQHLRNVYDDGELDEAATCKDFLQVQQEGNRPVQRTLKVYNLDAILAVGYRVRSPRGSQFRRWATTALREYLVKGFVLDDARLKKPSGLPDHFDELLAKIRDIRASEARMYLRLRDILALAADYRPSDPETQLFFQTVQNKLHFTVTGKTAPELIAERADAAAPNMGLNTWSGDAVRRPDVTVAKNYLRGPEIEELNRLVVMFLDFAEDQALRRKQVFLSDWQTRLDDFLRFTERPVLATAGTVSRVDADRLAHERYETFRQRRITAAEAAGEEAMLQAIEASLTQRPGAKKQR